MTSNLRKLKKIAALRRPVEYPRRDSNARPSVPETDALSPELRGPQCAGCILPTLYHRVKQPSFHFLFLLCDLYVTGLLYLAFPGLTDRRYTPNSDCNHSRSMCHSWDSVIPKPHTLNHRPAHKPSLNPLQTTT